MAILDRAIFEFRRGRPLFLSETEGDAVVCALDAIDDVLLNDLCNITETKDRLVLTAERAELLALPVNGADAISVGFSGQGSVGDWMAIAAEPVNGMQKAILPRLDGVETARPAERAALALSKSSKLLPSVVSFAAPERTPDRLARSLDRGDMLSFDAARLLREAGQDQVVLTRVSEADIALEHAQQSRFVCYRANDGFSEHIAILIGDWRNLDVVPVRLHSACLTGDLFGSLRCDCGEQLRKAVGRISDQGGGILLYLAQEGRGIGLANKLRAYSLQDTGLDTLDADHVLGFSDDERSYEAAAQILRDLGVEEIELLTNNPEKIRALEESGIQVRSRAELQGKMNRHNERYLTAKATRAGHLLDLAPETRSTDS